MDIYQRTPLNEVIQLMRVRHWVKNGFVLAPLLFSGKLFSAPELFSGLRAAVAFSLAASAVYTLNDWCDRHQDRLHPAKKTTPWHRGVSVRIPQH